MKRIEEIISNALAGMPETEVAILARELLKTRESLALAQQAKGEAEGRAALAERLARAMIIPPLNDALVDNAIRPTKPWRKPQPRDAAENMWLLIGEHQRSAAARIVDAALPVNHANYGGAAT